MSETCRLAKPLREVTRNEYALYNWIDVTALGDSQCMVIRGADRMPADAVRAWDDWKIWQNIIEGTGIYYE